MFRPDIGWNMSVQQNQILIDTTRGHLHKRFKKYFENKNVRERSYTTIKETSTLTFDALIENSARPIVGLKAVDCVLRIGIARIGVNVACYFCGTNALIEIAVVHNQMLWSNGNRE